MDSDRMKIVRVCKDDYEKVMDIIPPDEMYNGLDYLPDYFDMLLSMPNVEAYAVTVENGGKFVSFMLCHVVDDGETLVTRAGRTRKEFAHRSLIPLLGDHFFKTSKLGRRSKYFAGVTGTHTNRKFRQIKREFLNRVLHQDFKYYGCICDKTFMDQLEEQSRTTSAAKLLQEADIVDLLANSDLAKRLFPEGRLVADWVPFQLKPSNAPFIMTPRTSVVGSRLNNPKLALLTFLSYFNTTRGLICNLDVYGHISSTLAEHIYIHLNNIPLSKSENIVIRCLCKEGTQWQLVTHLMKTLSLEEQDIWGSSLLCFEFHRQGLTSYSKL